MIEVTLKQAYYTANTSPNYQNGDFSDRPHFKRAKALTAQSSIADDDHSAASAPKGKQTKNPKQLHELILESLDDSKAEEIVSIEIIGKSAIADYMVVASGRSHRHVSAVADRLLRDLKEVGHGTSKVEGMPACDWVLVDAGDVIIHIFRPEVRDFYNLEKLWNAIAEDKPIS